MGEPTNDNTANQSKKVHPLQIELLEMFSTREFSEQELIDIKKMISDYYMEIADKEMDQLFKEKNWDVKQKVEEWGKTHYRKKPEG